MIAFCKGGMQMNKKPLKKKELTGMADRIKERRKSLNYTQEQLAERVGISVSSYTRIENAFQKPALDTIIKISQCLKISLDYIVFGEKSVEVDISSELMSAILDFSDKDKLRHTADVLQKLIKLKED